MMLRALWVASLMALAALAQDGSTDSDEQQQPEDQQPEGPAVYDDNCFMCIAKGNMFCVSPAQQTAGKGEGSCLEATCKEQKDGETSTGSCDIVEESCATTSTPKKTFGQCGVPTCTYDITIDTALLLGGGVNIAEGDDEILFVSASQKVEVPAQQACQVTVSLADDVGYYLKGGWVLSQWMDSLNVYMTRLDTAVAAEAGETIDAQYEARSGLYSRETHYYSRGIDGKDDLAGRVPFSKDQQYRLIITNDDAENTKSLFVEYGAASMQFALSTSLLAVSFIMATLF